MDRLALYLSMISGGSIAGALVIVFFSLGWYTWWAIAMAAVIGIATAWPSAYIVSRRIKKNDPEWHPDHKPGDFGTVPPRDAPEV